MDLRIDAVAGNAGIQASAASLPPQRPAEPMPDASPAVTAVDPARQPTQTAVQQAVDAANKALANKPSSQLQFALEKGTGISVIKLIDLQTGDAIMQFPSQAMLEIAKTIDQVTGAIIRQKA